MGAAVRCALPLPAGALLLLRFSLAPSSSWASRRALVRVHAVAESGFPRAVARPPAGCKVTVETDVPMNGTVTVDVDSAQPSSGFV